MNKTDAIVGCLLGTAVGDAIGLPCEGLSRRRQRRLDPAFERQRLVLAKGMVSDDTEHTCFVAQALMVSAGEQRPFARALAWRLRFWLLTLPAGVGYATLRAIVRLWLGFGYAHSGVFSAGNGPAMRSAIIGVCYGHSPIRLQRLVRISTRVTHTDPKAECGAMAVAIAAYLSSQNLPLNPSQYLPILNQWLDADAAEFLALIDRACHSAALEEPAAAFADSLGLTKGISGYIYHTVPVVIQIWLRYPTDYRRAIAEIIALGGDTDTTAAILGGIIGARVGKSGIPQPWLDNLWEWPRTIRWLEQLGIRLATTLPENRTSETLPVRQPALPLNLWGILPRNLFFLIVVLLHGCRRLFPPY